MTDYFDPFPLIDYGGYFIKDITLKNKVVEMVLANPHLTDIYMIKDGDRPDTLAYQFYGDAGLHWVLLLANNIISIYDEWPVSDQILRQSIIRTFGEDGLEEVIYYLDQDGELRSYAEGLMVYPVTRYEHETKYNDAKRLIKIPKKELVNDIALQHLREIRR